MSFPPGHFYSPLPDLDDVRRREEAIFSHADPCAGIDLNPEDQRIWLAVFAEHAAALPWSREPRADRRYHYDNGFFCQGDAVALFGLLRTVKPARVVEVGSGYSSAAILDTLSTVHLTCIEPEPERLRALLPAGDPAAIWALPVQDVPLAVFGDLRSGDVLFIDSSHVAKVGSDVNHLIFHVLPRLPVGVFVHFHDIFYPFEYPASWVYDGRAWTEAYLLRAFLMHNPAWRIEYWSDYAATFLRDELARRLPTALENTGGSLWLRRIG